MSPPLIPERHGAASPTPRRFDKNSVQDWINVLHHAASVPAGHADYDEARDVTQQALEQIGHLQRQAGAQDRADQNFQPVNPAVSAVAGAAQGVTQGIGEPIAGLIDASPGMKIIRKLQGDPTEGSFASGAQQYREGLERVAESNPAMFAASEFGGQAVSQFLPIKGAIGTVEARVPLSVGEKALRIVKGGAAGAAVGGVAGFSAGGDDPGSIPQRLDQAKLSAEVGAVLGATATGVGLRTTRREVEGNADLVRKGVLDEQARVNLESAQTRLERSRGIGNEQAEVNLEAAKLRLERLQRRMDAGDAAPTAELPIGPNTQPPPPPTLPPDLIAAVREHGEGRITGPELRARMDAARGRTPSVETLRQDVATRLGEPAIATGPPQGPPSPPRAPFWPEPTPEQLAARQTSMPDKPFAELYPNAAAEAPPMSRPNELAPDAPTPKAGKAKTYKVGDTRFGAKVVEPGLHQKAAPGTRMDSHAFDEPSASAKKIADNIQSGNLEAARSQYQLAQGMSGVNQKVLADVARELERRGVDPKILGEEAHVGQALAKRKLNP